MASYVTIIDTSFRRNKVSTSPGTYMSDVLDQACKKFNHNPAQYSLKYKTKAIDLSLPYRLAGLPPGAELELVQASRSPTVVTVALQVSDPTRTFKIVNKFPSTTPLWQILRQFEVGQGENTPPNLNFTQRAVPQTDGTGGSGAGRLLYETPVINVMGRELASISDLQKTLAQLGMNNGNHLLRLSFRKTDLPLEEAMTEISQYFQAEEQPEAGAHAGAHADTAGQSSSVPDVENAAVTEDIAGLPNPEEPAPSPKEEAESSPAKDQKTSSTESAPSHAKTPTSTANVPDSPSPNNPPAAPSHPAQRQTTIYLPPSSTAPQATRHAFSEADYEPTVEHAKRHQAHLNETTRNKRLPSDAELAAAEKEKMDKLASISSVKIRVRLPDQSIVEGIFGSEETAADLYKWVGTLLRDREARFVLKYAPPKLMTMTEGGERLVKDLRLRNELVMMVWEDGVDAKTRAAPSLSQEAGGKAVAMRVEEPVPEEEKKDVGKGGILGLGKKQGGGGGGGSSGDKEAKLKKFLKFGKK
ncbi:hypothetical protein K402DRAFT_422780 [Aulographum hederae CBS 113979]|uniref:UBX domain-containing protein n=1 Tax=Aulographum hederae CBS 113979 TaxID=1176131 RepID=A0A6G1GUW7_9PEZI|nr:hypothetical protein K402DRAFT_422780 [Aulographum hederae CBS 113979]